jgi:alpha-beta hydrolase superfamily lysophospholipase
LVLGVLLAGYVAVLGYLWSSQEKLIFAPTVLPANYHFKLPPDVHEVFIDVPGARLDALHMQLPHPDGVVFYLHGNAGNLANSFGIADFYRALNFDLFMLDYRGYGKSTGHIESEAQLIADVQAAWQSIAPKYQGQAVVFVGRSLGTGLATKLAALQGPQTRPDLLVLVSPYLSMRAMATEKYPFVPPVLVRYPLRTDEVLPTLSPDTRVLMLHGAVDALIPVQQARELAHLARRAQLQVVPGAGHGDIQRSPLYLMTVRHAIRATVKPSRQAHLQDRQHVGT